jgi:hypothetical protein
LAQLTENAGVCFQGPVKVGAFDVSGAQAREWLRLPLNPNGRSNTDVLRPWVNGRDLTRRASDTWIIDFGEMTEAEAALYEGPFEYVRAHIKPFRDKNADPEARKMVATWTIRSRSSRSDSESPSSHSDTTGRKASILCMDCLTSPSG